MSKSNTIEAVEPSRAQTAGDEFWHAFCETCGGIKLLVSGERWYSSLCGLAVSPQSSPGVDDPGDSLCIVCEELMKEHNCSLAA